MQIGASRRYWQPLSDSDATGCANDAQLAQQAVRAWHSRRRAARARHILARACTQRRDTDATPSPPHHRRAAQPSLHTHAAATRQHVTAATRRCTHSAQTKTNMNRLIAALAPRLRRRLRPGRPRAGLTAAFAGAGKYEGMEFGFPEKKDLWENWDPNSPRSETNFNPFERNTDGNACDASGYFPGEGKYPTPSAPTSTSRP